MFGKRSHIDLKKSINKLRDYKKDASTRAKHLKIILDNVSVAESKNIFESNFSHVYITFFDLFIQSEFNLKQRVHKAHKDEFEFSLWLFEKILTLLPELIHKQWQANSIKTVLKKLLNANNAYRLRRQAIFYFLLWYQALDENATQDVRDMFAACLISDFDQQTNKVFFPNKLSDDFSKSSIEAPILAQNERVSGHTNKALFESFLDFILTSVLHLQWHDKSSQQLKAFHFLFEQFKVYYVPLLFPNFDPSTSIYDSNFELTSTHEPENEDNYHEYRIVFIKWLTYYLHAVKKDANLPTVPIRHHVHSSILNRRSLSFLNREETQNDIETNQMSQSLPSNNETTVQCAMTKEDTLKMIIRKVLYQCRENINFVHEVYRQTFLLGFTHSLVIRKVINLYKDLIQGNFLEVPCYLLEPCESNVTPVVSNKLQKLRNNSYVDAINESELLKVGSQAVIQIFILHSSNIFLCDTSSNLSQIILEEQTDCCKRILNVYRYMVMHIRMDLTTWEKFLLVLLHLTSTVITEKPPKNRNQTLTGKLAPALFQTLIVTWVKASLNIHIHKKLWDRFLYVLLSLTQWEDLINEWAKTMETLTRILARHVYKLDLNNLPLDKINEKKWKRNRHMVSSTTKIQSNKHVSYSGCDTKDEGANITDANTSKNLSSVTLSRSLSEANLNKNSLKMSSDEKEEKLKFSRAKSLSALPSTLLKRSQSVDSLTTSPIQLDNLDNSDSIHNENDGNKSVICGGPVRGWLPDAALILWKRMLSSLGNVNRFDDPQLHGKVFEHLVSITNTLIKIKLNQGISSDNQSTPLQPDLTPPLTLIVPWCFEALRLSGAFEFGQLNALRLLCMITVHCDPNYRTYLPEFYHVLHNGLCSSNRSTIDIILKHLGPKFLTLQLPGYSLLLLDLIHACNYVLNSSDMSSNAPRLESMSMLCSLLSLSDDVRNLIMFQPNALELNVITCVDFKEHIIDILLKVAKKERHLQARCVAINSLGIFVFRELKKPQPNSRVKDALQILNWTLKIKDRIILQACVGVLALFNNCVKILQKELPNQFHQTFLSICNTLSSLPFLPSYKSLLENFMHCLTEWCMEIGPSILLNENHECSLLSQVFKVFDQLIDGKITKINFKFPEDFDAEILNSNLDYQEPQIEFDKQCHREISLLAYTLSVHLVTHLGHFPMTLNASRLCSLVTEQDDVPDASITVDEQQSSMVFSVPNIQLLIINRHMLGSFVELPTLELPRTGNDLITADRQARVLIRDLCGKVCWDTLLLYIVSEKMLNNAPNITFVPFTKSMKSEALPIQSYLIRERPSNQLPDNTNAAHDLDQLNDLLRYLSHTSPEILANVDHMLNEIDSSFCDVNLENETIAILLNQENALKQYLKDEESFVKSFNQISVNEDSSEFTKSSSLSSEVSYCSTSLSAISRSSIFHYCCLLMTQLGLCSWTNRKKVQLLNKNDRLIRELRNLDNQCCRETHKVAVIFVESGQDDKISILSNNCGSEAYEEFLAGLAWEVELEHHTGFLGGLNKQGSTGTTTPYFATSLVEIVFHVSTRMPSDSNEAILNKTRHLGNDEIHIVWSEHYRDYRRDIIPTEFCDILIVIYPLGKRLNRVTITTKSEIPYFGPLFDEIIIENDLLPSLVRTTIIYASRAKRNTLPFYKQYFEERSDAIETVVNDCKEQTTFEEFISKIYSPIFPTIGSSVARTSGSYLMSLDSQSTSSTASSGYVVDQQQQQQQQSRIESLSLEHIDQSSSSISPMSLRRISKGLPRLTIQLDGNNVSPPNSLNSLGSKK